MVISALIRSTRLAAAVAVVSLGLSAGCSSSGGEWKETTERESKTTGVIDIQDFNRAAEKITQHMLTAPRVEAELAAARSASGDGLPLIKISRIKNSTTQKINLIDYFVAPIEEVLVNSGKADFFSEDRVAQDIATAGDLLNGRQARLADFVLHGTVSQLSTSAGRVDQNAYTFQLRLTNARTGSVIFAGSEQIIKQGR